MQTAIGHRTGRLASTLLLVLLLLATPALHAADQLPTTVVFFSDHALSDAQWSSLFMHIDSEIKRYDTASEMRAAPSQIPQPHFDLLRGDRVQPGLVVDSAISVYLHGDCSHLAAASSLSQPPRSHSGALGWVQLTDGQITPFIHINCALIAHQLGSSSLFQAGRSFDLASVAIARVFLHEWLHLSRQNPRHTHGGISKPIFTAEDLIGGQSAPIPRQPHPDGMILSSPIHGK